MNEKFFFELMKNVIFKKLTSAFSNLRNADFKEADIKIAINGLKKDGIIDAIKASGASPDIMKENAIKAFDAATALLRERFVDQINKIATEVVKQE